MVLGRVGRNFGAGMTGGIAYVYDPLHQLAGKISAGDFYLDSVVDEKHADKLVPLHKNSSDESILKDLLKQHYELTQSQIAKRILENFSTELGNFSKVFPHEYFNALKAMKEAH